MISILIGDNLMELEKLKGILVLAKEFDIEDLG